MQIDISFETWKTLTHHLFDENDSYDAVINRLLSEGGQPESDRKVPSVAPRSGAVFKGVFLPDGTELRATHRGKTYLAQIVDGQWIDSDSGERRTSPSQAAATITQGGVNGWLFWLVKRPQDGTWGSLNELRVR